MKTYLKNFAFSLITLLATAVAFIVCVWLSLKAGHLALEQFGPPWGVVAAGGVFFGLVAAMDAATGPFKKRGCC